MRVRKNRCSPRDEIGRDPVLNGLERIEADGGNAEPRLRVEALEFARQATFQNDIAGFDNIVARAACQRFLEEFALCGSRGCNEAANQHLLRTAKSGVAHILLRAELLRGDACRAQRPLLSRKLLGPYQVDVGRDAEGKLAVARRRRDAFDRVEQIGDRLAVEGHGFARRHAEPVSRRAAGCEFAQTRTRPGEGLVDRGAVRRLQARCGLLEGGEFGIDECADFLDGVAQLTTLAGEESGRRAALLLQFMHEPADPRRAVSEQTKLARIRAQRPGLEQLGTCKPCERAQRDGDRQGKAERYSEVRQEHETWLLEKGAALDLQANKPRIAGSRYTNALQVLQRVVSQDRKRPLR